MKKDYIKLVSVISCIGLLACLYQNMQLKQEIKNLRNTLDTNYDYLENKVDRIYSDVDDMLEREASLLSDYEWEYLDADFEKMEVSVLCRVTPKELDTGQTEAVLVYNEKEYPMELNQGTFETEITAPLFEDSVVEKVMFRTGETLQTEMLNWGLTPRHEYVTMVYGQYSGMGSGGVGSGDVLGWRMEGTVHVDIERKAAPVQVKSIALVEEIDGENLVHRSLVERKVVTEEGDFDREAEKFGWWRAAEAEIYAADGTPLFEIELEEVY